MLCNQTCARRMTVLAQVPKLLFGYETDEEQERAHALITWLETGQPPHPLIAEDHFEVHDSHPAAAQAPCRFFSSCRVALTSLRLTEDGEEGRHRVCRQHHRDHR